MSQRINLWASPRNVSTAIMYSFAQRTDCKVIDEPFYAAYLSESKLDHPGREEVLQSQATDFNQVIQETILVDYPNDLVFFKQMSHHVRSQPLDFIEECENLILIREPKEMIMSFSKVIDNPQPSDLGLEDSHRIYSYLKNRGKKAIIIDSKDLLANPELFLNKLCNKLNIPFNKQMLSWQAGAIPEDGIWARYWYDSVHRSTGFKPYKPNPNPLAEKHLGLYEKCKGLYLDLHKESIHI